MNNSAVSFFSLFFNGLGSTHGETGLTFSSDLTPARCREAVIAMYSRSLFAHRCCKLISETKTHVTKRRPCLFLY